LHEEEIISFAKLLKNQNDTEYETISGKLVEQFHRHGINLRHMGLVLYHLVNVGIALFEKKNENQCNWADAILIEIIARSVKAILNERMRAALNLSGSDAFGCYKKIIEVFNLLFGSQPADQFWQELETIILEKFFKRESEQFS